MWFFIFYFFIFSGWGSARAGSRKKKMWKMLNIIEFITKITDITNICFFFLRGVYPSLLYRILNAKTVRTLHLIYQK